MDGFLYLDFSRVCYKKFRAFLAILWVVGLLSGSFLALSQSDRNVSLITSASSYDMSLYMPMFLMFTIVVAVFISNKWLLLLLAYSKAFSFSYTWVCLLTIFDSSNWLMRVLLMFGDVLALPVFWLVWLRFGSTHRRSALLACVYGAVLVSLIGCVDYTVVVPFWAQLID